jgi:hypothetical protein
VRVKPPKSLLKKYPRLLEEVGDISLDISVSII